MLREQQPEFRARPATDQEPATPPPAPFPVLEPSSPPAFPTATSSQQQAPELPNTDSNDFEDITMPVVRSGEGRDAFLGTKFGQDEAARILQNTIKDPATLAALGAGALLIGGGIGLGQRLTRQKPADGKRSSKKGILGKTARTMAGLGLAGAGAYGAYRMLKPNLGEATEANPYGAAFKPSSVLGGSLGTFAAIGSFPLADYITSGMKEGPLKSVANIGAKAILSTLGTAAAGYGGWKAGREIEKAQEKRRQEKLRKENPYLPRFYGYELS